MAKLRMAHASTHGARKPPEPKERLNDGNNNGQDTHGARKHAWRTQAAWANNKYFLCSNFFLTYIAQKKIYSMKKCHPLQAFKVKLSWPHIYIIFRTYYMSIFQKTFTRNSIEET